jgi:putative membrane protein
MPDRPVKPDSDPAALVDASRRTYLAGERTQLAWWRTGLTALAVALGVGRVVPELNGTATRWPYVIAGVGFALWGIFAIAYGTANREAMEKALRQGRFHEAPTWPLRTLSLTGIALGLLTATLILLD